MKKTFLESAIELEPDVDGTAATSTNPVMRVLLVGGSAPLLHRLAEWVTEAGAEASVVTELPLAARQLAEVRFQLVVAVLSERANTELSWWADMLREVEGHPRLIALTKRPTMGLLLQAEQLGVADVLSDPPSRELLHRSLGRFLHARLEAAVPLPTTDAHVAGEHALVGESPAMVDLYRSIARAAPSAATVLLQGESGTGKEVVARALHESSLVAAGPFVAVNCAAIPEHLLESELFGHERGSFTGALSRRIGRFEQAMHGTLFLDEIADMSLVLQAKILRAVQERCIERVGGGESIPIKVRLIAATNRDLSEAIAQRRFREDLYYRLAVVTLRLPRLVERSDDLLLLVAHFARMFAARDGKRITAISDRALGLLRGHRWPGNVRELRNVIERAVIVADDSTIRSEDVRDQMQGEPEAAGDGPSAEPATLAEVEARHIARVLAHAQGQIGTAAQILGIHRNTLTRKLREYGL